MSTHWDASCLPTSTPTIKASLSSMYSNREYSSKHCLFTSGLKSNQHQWERVWFRWTDPLSTALLLFKNPHRDRCSDLNFYYKPKIVLHLWRNSVRVIHMSYVSWTWLHVCFCLSSSFWWFRMTLGKGGWRVHFQPLGARFQRWERHSMTALEWCSYWP